MAGRSGRSHARSRSSKPSRIPVPTGLLLDADEYAATFEVPKGEIVHTAERLRGLVQALYGTAAMPHGRGILVSVGGDTVDLVIGSDPSVAFLGIDADDRFGFRVVERFVLRVKNRLLRAPRARRQVLMPESRPYVAGHRLELDGQDAGPLRSS